MKPSLRNELARAIRNRHYEETDAGLYFPGPDLFVGGSARSNVNGRDHRLFPNIYVKEGRIDLLNVYFKQGSVPTGFYLAPFAGNVAPDDTVTAANFAQRQTEFTAYDEATRVVFVAGDVDNPQVDNSASLATFTINVANSTVWGFGLITNQVKQGTTGKLISCFKDQVARTGLQVGDKLNVEYVITAQDAG